MTYLHSKLDNSFLFRHVGTFFLTCYRTYAVRVIVSLSLTLLQTNLIKL
jgi:hypothetical protein